MAYDLFSQHWQHLPCIYNMQTLWVLKPCQDHDENIDLVDAKNPFIIISTANIISDKILESLASGTNSKDTVRPLLASTLKTTAQYGSCNQASHTQSQIIHLIRQIAYPLNRQ